MADTTLDMAGEAQFGDYVELLKPRVMRLVIFTAAVGMFVAPNSVHPVIAFASILCIAVGAGASGALNMWWDRDIDAVMKRTSGRPIPSGRIAPGEALGLGVALAAMSVTMLGLFANIAAAALLAFTIFFYAVVYSMWLKRATPHNIVIGGAAGAFPPMLGWVVATGGISIEPVLMFALIFIWTPPHFWSLSLFMNDDYQRAGVPMLTVTHGREITRTHILVYTLVLALTATLPVFAGIGGVVYGVTALVLNSALCLGAYRLWRRPHAQAIADNYARERGFFRLTLWYLFLHFAALIGDAALASVQ